MMNKSSKDLFQSIAEFPHNIGIYLTYTLDTEVIDKLTEYATGTKLILHDFKQGKTIDDNDNSTIICIPVITLKPNEHNCFHAKMVLLKSEIGAKFIVGSANLSVDSFISEKDIALEMELNFDKSTDVFIYNKILDFFEQLRSQLLVSNSVWDQTLNKLRLSGLPVKKGDIRFVFNSADKSIFDEFKIYLKELKVGQKVRSLKIVTPFVSHEYQRIEELRNITDEISIYLRNGAKINPFIKHHFKIFQPANKKREGFHSKIFLAEFNSDSVLFIGSANFTEQGFFKTLNESANQECGIILNVPITEMQGWFNEELWKQLSEIEIDNYKDEGWVEDFDTVVKTYAWAEKENSNTITYIFNPDQLPVSKTKEGNKITLLKVNDNFLFKTNEFKEQNQKVHFYIGDNKYSIPVFDLNEYLSALSEKGESILDPFKGIYSVNPKELDIAIDKEKLSVSETTIIKISEPPILEQYFYNVKYLIQNIKNKKYFSEYNEKEISDLLNGVLIHGDSNWNNSELESRDSGRYIYLALQLLRVFKTKINTDNLSDICEKSITNLSKELNMDENKFKSFKKRWLTSKI